MNFTNTDLVSIYNSRQTLIDVMQGRGYDVSSYNNFNIFFKKKILVVVGS